MEQIFHLVRRDVVLPLNTGTTSFLAEENLKCGTIVLPCTDSTDIYVSVI